jgi:hypothetical protein
VSEPALAQFEVTRQLSRDRSGAKAMGLWLIAV